MNIKCDENDNSKLLNILDYFLRSDNDKDGDEPEEDECCEGFSTFK